MPFECDPKSWTQASGEPLSTWTQKFYRSALNKLSKEGWTTKEDLLEKQKEVVAHIKGMEASNHNKRLLISAIFKVLADVPYEERAEYYQFFQTIKTE